MNVEDVTESQFEDFKSLEEGYNRGARQAKLEAREHELTVTVPMALSTTMMLS